MDYDPVAFTYNTSITQTIADIIADTLMKDSVAFFTDGTNGYYYANGTGTGTVNFDTALIKLNAVTTPPPATALVGAVPINDAPIVSNDTGMSSTEDVALTIKSATLLANDIDPDGDTLTITGVAMGLNSAQHGTVALNPNGDVVFTPSAQLNQMSNGALNVIEFTYTVSDGNGGVATGSAFIDVTGVNDAPVLTAGPGSLTNFVEDAVPQVVDAGLTLADVDGLGFASATVTIGGFVASEDRLTFNAGTSGLTGSFNTATGVLTLSGNAQTAAYEAVLRSVTYQNISNNPTVGDRLIDFKVNDGQTINNFSNALSNTISITATNDAPIIEGNTWPLDVPEDTVTSGIISAFDLDGDALTYSVAATGQPTNGTVVFEAANSGSFTYTPNANYNGTDSFTTQVDDGHGGTTTAVTNINVTAINDAPNVTSWVFGATNFVEGTAIVVDSGVTLTDVDSRNLVSAIVKITAKLDAGKDVLAFTNTATITGTYDSATGTLALSGSDTLANYQAALRSVTYNTTSGNPSTLARSIDFTVNDGALNSTVHSQTVAVTAVNNAPDIIGVGALNGFLQFDGVNDLVNLGAATSLATGTGAFTYEAWINTSSTARQQILTTGSSGVMNEVAMMYVQATTGKLAFDTTNIFGPRSTSVVNDGKWHHVSVVYDGTTTQLYVDGTADGSGTANTPNISSVANARIGSYFNGTAETLFFAGEIADVRTWNTALKGTDIKANMNQSLAGNEPGLSGYWPLDKVTNGVTPDLTTHANGGTLGNGIVGAGAEPILVTTNGKALAFDGVDDVVETGLTNLAASYTLEGWVNVNSLTTNNAIFSKSTVTSGQLNDNSEALFYINAAGNVIFVAGSGANPTNAATWAMNSSTATVAVGQWNHVAVTVDAVNQQTTVYLNGVGTTATYTTPLVSGTLPLEIGHFKNQNQVFMDGQMADMRVWNGVRTAAEIQSSMSGQLGDTTALAGYWPLADGTGTTIHDYSGHNLNGTLVNNALGDAAWVNTLPNVFETTIHINDGQTYNDVIIASDVNGDPLTFSLNTDAAYGQLVLNADGSFSYTSNANFAGMDSFIVDVFDGIDTTTQTITVRGNLANYAPKITSASTLAVTEDTVANGTITATDADGNRLTYSVSDGANGTVTINSSTGVYSYTPNANFSGTDSFTVFASDGVTATTQWASSAIASSQLHSINSAAFQAADVNTIRSYGDNVLAWAPATGSQAEWLEVSYLNAVHATGVNIYETFNTGFVTQVEYKDTTGVYHKVWSGTDTTTPGAIGVFNLTMAPTSYLVNAVRISTQSSGFEEIDAVKLFGDASMTTQTIDVTIAAVNDAAVIGLPSVNLSATGGGAPVVVDAGATLTDVDSANFSGGTLTVDVGVGGTANDRLSILIDDTSSVQLVGSAINVYGTQIGTVTGGTSNVDPLVISLNANSTVQNVQELIQNVTYQNVSTTPSTTARPISFTLVEADGTTSAAVNQTMLINDAAVNTAPVIKGLAQSNGALAFDGVNDAVTIAHNAVNNPTTGITFETWVKTSSTGRVVTLFNETASVGRAGWELLVNTTGHVAAYFIKTTTTDYMGSTGATNVADGAWHHIAVSYDNTNMPLIYIDGVADNSTYMELNSSGSPANYLVASSADVTLGNDPVLIGRQFVGQLGESRLWDKALSKVEIEQAMNARVDGKDVIANLVGSWDLGTAANGVVKDLSGNNNNAVLGKNTFGDTAEPTLVATPGGPVSYSEDINVSEDTVFNGTITSQDADVSTTFTHSLYVNAYHGTVTVNANGTFAYTPTKNYAGPDKFIVAVNDGTATVAKTILINVTGVAVTVTGTTGADILVGGGGDDTLYGGAGSDTLTGNIGNDRLDGGSGVDSVQNGTGLDVAIFNGKQADYTITENPDGSVIVTDNVGMDGTDTLINIETLRFSDGDYDLEQTRYTHNVAATITGASRNDTLVKTGTGIGILNGLGGNDTLKGGSAGDTISGGSGNDMIDGGAGSDTATFAGLAADYTVTTVNSVNAHTTVKHNATGDVDMLINIETIEFLGETIGSVNRTTTIASYVAPTLNVIAGTTASETLLGTVAADLISGYSGNDSIDGAGGNDTIIGGTGRDTITGGYGNDIIDGSSGTLNDLSIDMAMFSGNRANYTITTNTLTGETIVVDTVGLDGVDVIKNVEVLRFGDYALISNENDVTLSYNMYGNGNVTAMSGNIGNDTLTGYISADTINGGAGDDLINGGGGNDILNGDAGNDTLIGGAGNDTISGGQGADRLDGGLGMDTVDYSTSLDGVTVDLNIQDGKFGQFVSVSQGFDQLINFENIMGSGFNDILIGDVNANVITGGAGTDVMTGGAGGDTFVFGPGDVAVGLNMDIITDFNAGTGTTSVDQIDLLAIMNGTAFNYTAGSTTFSGLVGEALFDNATSILSIDITGNSTADFELQLDGVTDTNLDATDFIVGGLA
ncbi:MAG: tandem-95 repeat protein [Magnetovibrio sp.]|nr:tandem-95 repeat protein [Magnetovibrio sp.]